MQVKVKTSLEAEIESKEVGYAIRQFIAEVFGKIDDAGCDGYTDENGNVCISDDPHCPFGHAGATYVSDIEAVRCPECGLIDVSI